MTGLQAEKKQYDLRHKRREYDREYYRRIKATAKITPDFVVCTHCKEQKSSSEYFKNSRTKTGLNRWCKPCLLAAKKDWIKRNPGKVAGYQYRASRKNRSKPHVLYVKYRGEARKRKREFSLTLEEFTNLASSPCFYSGHRHAEQLNGIDRVDNSKGYTMDNVVPCCKLCNRAKRDMNVDEFVDWAKNFRWTDPWSRIG